MNNPVSRLQFTGQTPDDFLSTAIQREPHGFCEVSNLRTELDGQAFTITGLSRLIERPLIKIALRLFSFIRFLAPEIPLNYIGGKFQVGHPATRYRKHPSD